MAAYASRESSDLRAIPRKNATKPMMSIGTVFSVTELPAQATSLMPISESSKPPIIRIVLPIM